MKNPKELIESNKTSEEVVANLTEKKEKDIRGDNWMVLKFEDGSQIGSFDMYRSMWRFRYGRFKLYQSGNVYATIPLPHGSFNVLKLADKLIKTAEEELSSVSSGDVDEREMKDFIHAILSDVEF